MEFFETAKTWLTDNAVWLGALAAALAVLGTVIWAPFGLLKRAISGSQKGGGTSVMPIPTHNLPPNLDVYLNPLIELARKNGKLESEQEWAQEKAALLRTIEDLKCRQGPDASDALEHMKSGETGRAKQLYTEIAEIRTRDGASATKEAVGAYINLAAIATLTSYDEAEDAYTKALQLDPDNPTALSGLGGILFRKGNLEKAKETCERLLESKNEKVKAISLNNLGLIAKQNGAIKEAEELFLRALSIEDRLGDEHGKASTFLNLGSIVLAQGMFETAEKFFGVSMEYYEKNSDKEGIARTLISLGSLARAQGQLNKAQARHLRAQKIYEELGDKEGVAVALSNLGKIAGMRGQPDKARELWTASRNRFAEIGISHNEQKVQTWIDTLPEKDSH